MEPHNPEDARHGPGVGAKQQRNATAFWLTVTIIAFAVAAVATTVSYL